MLSGGGGTEKLRAFTEKKRGGSALQAAEARRNSRDRGILGYGGSGSGTRKRRRHLATRNTVTQRAETKEFLLFFLGKEQK